MCSISRVPEKVFTTLVPMLEVKALAKAFGRVNAVSNVSFECRAGEVLAIVGENGAGKSTLIKCMARAIDPDHGTILVEGRPLGKTPAEVARQGLSVVWQDLALCDNLDTVANIFLGREGQALLDPGYMRVETDRLLERLELEVSDVTAPVGRVSSGVR